MPQHPIGELGPDGQHEPFGEAVRNRTPGQDLDSLNTRIRKLRVEGGRETAPRDRRPGTESRPAL